MPDNNKLFVLYDDIIVLEKSYHVTMLSRLDTVDSFTDTVESRLYSVWSFTDTLESTNDTLKDFTDTLESTNATILSYTDTVESRLYSVWSFTDTLESSATSIKDYTDYVESMLATNETAIYSVAETNESMLEQVWSQHATIEAFTDYNESMLATNESQILLSESRLETDVDLAQSMLQTNETDISRLDTLVISQHLTNISMGDTNEAEIGSKHATTDVLLSSMLNTNEALAHYFEQSLLPISMNTTGTIDSVATTISFIESNGINIQGLISTTDADAKKCMLIINIFAENTYDGINSLSVATTQNLWQWSLDGGSWHDLLQMNDGDWETGAQYTTHGAIYEMNISTSMLTNIDGNLGLRLSMAQTKKDSMKIWVSVFGKVLWQI